MQVDSLLDIRNPTAKTAPVWATHHSRCTLLLTALFQQVSRLKNMFLWNFFCTKFAKNDNRFFCSKSTLTPGVTIRSHSQCYVAKLRRMRKFDRSGAGNPSVTDVLSDVSSAWSSQTKRQFFKIKQASVVGFFTLIFKLVSAENLI
jgi:hypothetical protein